MQFRAFDINDCEGLILAHSHRLAGQRIAKGSQLTRTLIDAFIQHGVQQLVCAAPDQGDLSEDEVADRLAGVLLSAGLVRTSAATGRVNFKTEAAGIIRYDRDLIKALNSVDESLTLSLVQHNQLLSTGQMVATLKVIPYFVSEAICHQFEQVMAGKTAFHFHPLRGRQVSLIQTMDHVLQDKVYAATEAVTETRLHQLGCKLISRQRCAHNSVDVAAEIQAARTAGAELILLCGCSAIADRQDILPMAIEDAGGQIDQLGLAVDPGNMLLIGHIDSLPVIGMPGCARSPKLNGFDWVLHLLLADIELSRDELADMAAGGLLMEIASRPLPRDLAVKPASPMAQMSAVVLAAGQSRRMGKINKLTAVVAGKPVIRHVVDTVLEAGFKDIVVVLGYDEQAVSACLEGLPVRFVKNEAFRSGQASSVSAGIAALDNNVSDAMVVLGDMPLLNAALLNNLHHHHMRTPQHEQMISLPVCSKDRESQVGHPVIWGRQFFPDLQALTGDQGGRQIWSDHPAIINQMDVEDATLFLDTDTAEALRQAEVLLLARN